MSYRVRTTRRAEIDAEQIYDWIAEHEGRPLEALRWLDGLDDAITSLGEHPLRCPRAPESEYLGVIVRHLLFHSHRVLFVVEGREVVVLHVRHGSRLPLGTIEFDEEAD